MSSDNGFMIVKDGKRIFHVYEYSASMEYDTFEDMHLWKTFDNLEDALSYATEQYSEYGTEYADRTEKIKGRKI